MGNDPTHCGYCHHWTGDPGFYKKTGWTRHGEQGSKQHTSMSSASGPVLQSSGSCPGCVPVLISFSDKVWCGSVCRRNAFPMLLWSLFITAVVSPAKTWMGSGPTCTYPSLMNCAWTLHNSGCLQLCILWWVYQAPSHSSKSMETQLILVTLSRPHRHRQEHRRDIQQSCKMPFITAQCCTYNPSSEEVETGEESFREEGIFTGVGRDKRRQRWD